MEPDPTPAACVGERLPTGLVLPSDCRVPRTLAIRAGFADEHQPWQQPYASRFLELTGQADFEAWFHFCTGHHVEFMYWEATIVACERALAAAESQDAGAVGQWLVRVGALIRGSAAMLHYCAAFDTARYDPCLRPSMAAERDDFSGDMSRDFLAMMAARARVQAEFADAHPHYSEQIEALQDADSFWHRHHGHVVVSLHPGSSLLREKLAQLRRERESFDPTKYIATVVRSERAMEDYDDYFGVLRVDEMKVGDYFTQAVEKLAAVHRGFEMDAETRSALMVGDATLLAVISEMLEEPKPE